VSEMFESKTTDILRKTDFDFELPNNLIAQTPLNDRSASRLLVCGRTTGEIAHRSFTDLTDYITSGDCLVFNDTEVIPARLTGTGTKNAGTVSVTLLKKTGANLWEALVKPGRKMKQGNGAVFGNGLLECKVTRILDGGIREIEFSHNGIFEEILEQLGEMPLPPYIKTPLEDKNRYQTVYAKNKGAAAAATAGLHFTVEFIGKLRAMGVKTAFITLHTGLGTFRPVKEDIITNHKMHEEYYCVEQSEADKINGAKQNGNKIIAVGTTSVRTLESAADEHGHIIAGSGNTDIFIYPGYKFKIADAIITNFHLPQSTLIMLVSAFAGRENILNAYAKAVEQGYRFFSFGDAMLIV